MLLAHEKKAGDARLLILRGVLRELELIFGLHIWMNGGSVTLPSFLIRLRGVKHITEIVQKIQLEHK